MAAEPDLTRELDEAEDIITGRIEALKIEWGVRYDDLSGEAAILGTGPDNERRARHEVRCWPDSAVLVRPYRHLRPVEGGAR
jgi:hypothetical protein